MPSELGSKTCSNCLHKHEKSVFTECQICLRDSKQGNQFPGWKPEKKENNNGQK